jgi:hypothetical protein
VDFGASCSETSVYEDLGSMVAALAMLGKYPFYSTGALTSLREAFLEGYQGTLDQRMVGLYALRFSVRMLSEMAQSRTPRVTRWLRMWRAETKVLGLAHGLPA